MNAAPVLFLSLLGAVLMSGQVFGGSYVPLRCTCLTVTEVVKEPLSDIKVIEKGPDCENTQIIVTLKPKPGDGLPREVCLNPSGKQAKRLQDCLKRNEEKKRCLRPQTGRRGRKHKLKRAQKWRPTSKRNRARKQKGLAVMMPEVHVTEQTTVH